MPASAERSERPTAQSCLNDLAYVVAHEFNNLLNNIVLQLAVLDLASTGATAAGLSVVRQQGAKAASLVRQFQQALRQDQTPPTAVNLNQIVQRVADEYAGDVGLSLQLAANPPLVSSTMTDLQCLVRLLIESAREANGQGLVTVRTGQTGGHALLRVEDEGAHAPLAMLPHLFEPFAVIRHEQGDWKLAVCKAIARRLQGTIQGENRPEGGMAFNVRLRLATPEEGRD